MTGTQLDPALESHHRPYRKWFGGYCEISGFVLGLNANIGQNRKFLNHPAGVINPALDDLSFLIGYGFDVNKLLGAAKNRAGL